MTLTGHFLNSLALPLVLLGSGRIEAAVSPSSHFPQSSRSWLAGREPSLRNTQDPIIIGDLGELGTYDAAMPDPHVVPLVPFENIQHFTGITLGNPPQLFRTLIDISWPDLFVPSIACKSKYPGICNGHFSYHPSWSRTHVATDKGVKDLFFEGLYYSANISLDTFAIAGIEVPNQHFHEGYDVFTHPATPWVEAWDAILGLAPDSASSLANASGPLTSMFERGLLDTDTVSIMLGRSGAGIGLINGELMLGGVNEEQLLPNTTMRFVAMSNKTDAPNAKHPLCNSTWQVPVQAVSVTWLNETSGENQTERVQLDAGYTARLDTAAMYLMVPARIRDVLWELASPIEEEWYFPFILCSQRAKLPDIVFTLGDGDEAEEFVLTPYDYTLESMTMGFGRQCLWTVLGAEWFYEEAKVLELGSPFMRGFYVALDKGAGRIGLGTPRWKGRYMS